MNSRRGGQAVTPNLLPVDGVETDEQLALMLSLDCDYAQGYYFSRPVDSSKATELLASPAPWLEFV